ncbi:XRE family transcriptional regulator [Oscillatoria sp. CS-180]|uniref:helix-turn-helix domain-containing protein n=1 Tax=Oscillatoria sp. CS-180 TaxID=3021720 RepID=UPI00232B450B|nr:XRE family transcriptional regulator [Oscillatoria sp. CS-180]MDB9524550.1 XRE family transcriptional regulator [Oscillatoria sp. CS-180]
MITLDQDFCFKATLSDYAIAEARTFQVRTELMLALQQAIQQHGWTPEEAAESLKQTLPRMQNLMNGEVSRFSIEQLIQLLSLVGRQVQISVAT